MTINLVSRNIVKNKNINYSLLKQVCYMGLEYLNCAAICTCPVSTLTYHITSQYSPNGFNKLKGTHTSSGNCKRFCSTNSQPSDKLPPLMNFPEIVWPSLIKSFRNFILATFIIKPYLDREFNLPDFVKGSKKALEVVSSKLSEGDVKSLDGLVTKDVINDLEKSVSPMSLSQKQMLMVNQDDIYFSFPYQVQVGMIFTDEEGNEQKRFVEITMVYHILRGLGAMRIDGEEPPLNVGMLPEYKSRISICNYRFIREFTKGVDADWTVNVLNHFRPVDSAE